MRKFSDGIIVKIIVILQIYCYTVTANGGGATHGYHYERSRSRLTNRRKARFQTFPDTFKFRRTYGKQREIIGNAVPPLLDKAVNEAVIEIDRLLL